MLLKKQPYAIRDLWIAVFAATNSIAGYKMCFDTRILQRVVHPLRLDIWNHGIRAAMN